MDKANLIFLEPVFHEKVWGGRRLASEFGYELPEGPIGEAWAISTHPAGESLVAKGPGEGGTLSRLWRDRPDLFRASAGEVFPLLVKLIDAEEDVSIQVHPDDAYAKDHGVATGGKRECWYILAAKPGATIIVGQHAKSAEELEERMGRGEWDEVLNEVPIAAGDFFQVDPGTVHAVKAGTLLLEIQQPSDVTYRLWDYDRPDVDGNLRELHVADALATIDFAQKPPEGGLKAEELLAHAMKSPSDASLLFGKPLSGSVVLEANDAYTVELVQVMGTLTLPKRAPFWCVAVVEGKGSLNGEAVAKGDFLIVPAGTASVSLEGTLRLVVAYV